MKVAITLISLLLLMFFTACNKDSNGPDAADSTTRVKEIRQYIDSSFTNDFALTTYTYDELGRCILRVSNNTITNLHSIDSIFYSGTTVKWKKLNYYNSNPRDIAVRTTTYSLDDNGRAYYSIDNSADSTQTNYDYDASGYLVKKVTKTSNYTDTTYYTNTSGNQTYIEYGESSTATQTYNSRTNFIGTENLGVSFLGKQNQNLVLKIVWNINTPYSSQDIYEYKYDSRGRVSRQIEISGLLNDAYYLVYTYK
jgi:YD repeat-containing protein